MIQELIDRTRNLQNQLRRGTTINVNDRGTKGEAINLATAYFESFRPVLIRVLGETDNIKKHDDQWQELVKLAHGNNQRITYRKILGGLAKELRELSVAILSRSAESTKEGALSILTPSEQQIIATLDALLPPAAASYRQGILDLRDADRLSYRGTASEFRETLRETLDHLAPDDEVTKQPGFQYEDGQKKPTMKQKVRYVLRSRGRSTSQRDVAERSIKGVEDLAGEIARATYNRASVATHLETTRAEVIRIKRYVDTVLFDLLEIAESPRGLP
jgi:Predicted pPIWI-associating nuclease